LAFTHARHVRRADEQMPLRHDALFDGIASVQRVCLNRRRLTNAAVTNFAARHGMARMRSSAALFFRALAISVRLGSRISCGTVRVVERFR
jgi:hypothetical protein